MASNEDALISCVGYMSFWEASDGLNLSLLFLLSKLELQLNAVGDKTFPLQYSSSSHSHTRARFFSFLNLIHDGGVYSSLILLF